MKKDISYTVQDGSGTQTGNCTEVGYGRGQGYIPGHAELKKALEKQENWFTKIIRWLQGR